MQAKHFIGQPVEVRSLLREALPAERRLTRMETIVCTVGASLRGAAHNLRPFGPLEALPEAFMVSVAG